MPTSSPETSELAQSVRTLKADAPSMQEATKLLEGLRRDIAALTPETLAFAAIQRQPGRVVDALAALSEDFGEIFADLAFIGEKIAKAVTEERERLAPLLHEAAVRHMHNESRITDMPRMIEHAQAVPEVSRKPLRAAGYTKDQVKQMIPEADVSHLLAEKVHLEAENAALRAFLDSHNVTMLPEGFTITPPSQHNEHVFTMPFIPPLPDFEPPVVIKPYRQGR